MDLSLDDLRKMQAPGLRGAFHVSFAGLPTAVVSSLRAGRERGIGFRPWQWRKLFGRVGNLFRSRGHYKV